MRLDSVLFVIFSIFGMTMAQYKIGVGRADCTGPAAEIVFMGYAKTSQKGCGIHLRQFSRAFIFDDGSKRAAFVSVDAGMMAQGVKKAVVDNLKKLYDYDIYTDSNLILSGTHTHSAPGGFLMDFLYDLPNMGFLQETFDALVDGITKSIRRAHENMVDGRVFLSSGELLGASINRSPPSYLLNPEKERHNYHYNVDKEMVQLKLVDSKNNLIGAIHWFAVHPTSMNFSNCLITSDNVGYASILLEKSLNKDTSVGKGRFVATFASTNLGDVSPNTKGGRCITTGEECDAIHSTCGGVAKDCVAFGPGKDMFESTKMIAEKMYEKAKVLLGEKGQEVHTPIRHAHKFVNMPKETAEVELENGTTVQVRGCLPAMGYSFAAGTTDGVGESGFSQGTFHGNSRWNTIRDFLFKPTQDDIDCHYPKPILINSGRISTPYEWQPQIVATQIVQLGEVVLIAVPGEFTTMSGRRLRNAITEIVIKNGGSKNTKSIITGLSNTYTSYVTTPEEYQTQRYEGASTIYGPHTLTLYLNIYKKMAKAMLKGEAIDPGPSPPDLSTQVISLVPGVIFDTSGFLHSFGECVLQPQARVKRGMQVSAKFISGHPRNNPMHEKTFLTVEKVTDDKNTIVATDGDWDTKFYWKRTSSRLGGSEVTVEWNIPESTTPGVYLIRHFGFYKSILGGVYPYKGSSRKFLVM